MREILHKKIVECFPKMKILVEELITVSSELVYSRGEIERLKQNVKQASSNSQEDKRLIGEMLYPKIAILFPSRAGKITGMLLEMDNEDLFKLLRNAETLQCKVEEALDVLNNIN